MKCPVCGESCDSQVNQCPECGFNQLHKEFINENEYKIWFVDTVDPCKAIYSHRKNQSSALTKLERQNKRQLKIINDILLILTDRMLAVVNHMNNLSNSIPKTNENKKQHNIINEIKFNLSGIFWSIGYHIPKKYMKNKRLEEISRLEREFSPDDDYNPFENLPF